MLFQLQAAARQHRSQRAATLLKWRRFWMSCFQNRLAKALISAQKCVACVQTAVFKASAQWCASAQQCISSLRCCINLQHSRKDLFSWQLLCQQYFSKILQAVKAVTGAKLLKGNMSYMSVAAWALRLSTNSDSALCTITAHAPQHTVLPPQTSCWLQRTFRVYVAPLQLLLLRNAAA